MGQNRPARRRFEMVLDTFEYFAALRDVSSENDSNIIASVSPSCTDNVHRQWAMKNLAGCSQARPWQKSQSVGNHHRT
jgi:hypothetical protein